MNLPDRRVLEKLFRGQLPSEVAEKLRRKLDDPEYFARVAEAIMADDTFVGALGETKISEAGASPAISDLMRRFRAWKSSAPASGTVAGPGVPIWSPQAGEPSTIGHFRVVRKLGQGGMGAVYLGEDSNLNRKAALKIMRPEFASNPEARERFLREARAAAALEHDNIVAIWQVGEDAGMPFIAMPFLQGESLDDRLQREPKSSVGVILKLAREAAEGLAAAHERGMIHRDIKPANLWIEGEPASPSPPKAFRRTKILDFGLARFSKGDVQLTSTGAVLGTPAFMSPEQGRGLPLDARSDLFSLGVVLYRMATGELPFKGDSIMAMLMSLGMDTPEPPSSKNDKIPPALSALILRLLEKEPKDRYQSAREVLVAVLEIARERSSKGAVPSSASVPRMPDSDFRAIESPDSTRGIDRAATPVTEPVFDANPRADRPKSGARLGVLLLLVLIAFGSVSAAIYMLTDTDPKTVVVAPTKAVDASVQKEPVVVSAASKSKFPIPVAKAGEHYRILITELVPLTKEVLTDKVVEESRIVDGKLEKVPVTTKVKETVTEYQSVTVVLKSEIAPEVTEEKTPQGVVYHVTSRVDGQDYSNPSRTEPEITVETDEANPVEMPTENPLPKLPANMPTPAPAPGYEPTKFPPNALAPPRNLPAPSEPTQKPPAMSKPGPIPKK